MSRKMKFIVTTPSGKELLIDETHVCSKNSPLQCTKLSKEMIDAYMLIVGSEEGYSVEGTE